MRLCCYRGSAKVDVCRVSLALGGGDRRQVKVDARSRGVTWGFAWWTVSCWG